MAHPVDPGSPKSSDTGPPDYTLVWGATADEARARARDKLLLELGRATLVLMNNGLLSHGARDSLGRAVNEFERALR